jgi:hypothetical protein
MSHSYDELKKMTVAELREISAGLQHEALQGYSQLNKEHLLVQLCKALSIDVHIHHKAAATAQKAGLKKKIKELKVKRTEAISSKNYEALKRIRRRIHFMKRAMRAVTM